MDGERKLIVFTAPSGAGKTTIVNHLLKTDSRLAFSVSACTREKRPKEIHGKDYYFLSVEEFKRKADNHEFLEWEEVYNNIFYGTLFSEVDRLTNLGKAVLFDIDVKGALNIKKQFGDQALTVFIKPPSLDTLIQRLSKRDTENEITLKKRIDRMKYELSMEDQFDLILVNDNLQTSLRKAEDIVDNFVKGLA